jgi:hypothetical protein
MKKRGTLQRLGGLVLTITVTMAAFPFVAPTPAFATTRPIFGIASNLGSVDGNTREQAYTMLQTAGASWARVGSYWPYIDRNGKAARDWGTSDSHLAAAKAHNMTVVGSIAGYAAWANGSRGDWYVPADPTEYANFVRDTVNRYKADVHYWEIWNEPNLEEFWAPAPNPAAYAKLLRAAYLAVKQADPTAKVVFGGICRNDYTYLNNAYTALKAYPDAAANDNFFDVLAVHPYADDRAPEVNSSANIWGGMDRNFAGLPKMKTAMTNQGDPDKHIIVTEFGWVVTDISWTQGVGTALQADYLKRAYAMAQDWPWLDAMMWYGFKNWDGSEAPYSIVNTDLTARPAYNAMKEAAAGGVTVTDPGTGGTTGGGTTGETTATAGGGTGGSTPTTTTSSKLRPKRPRPRAYTLNTLYASVSPDQAGHFVQVQKYSAGRWVTIRTAKLGYGSRYSYTYRTRRGAAVYRLRFLGSTDARQSVSAVTRVVAL